MKWNRNGSKKGLVVSMIAGFALIVGIVLLIGANVTGIGVFLYQWGKLDLAIGASAWMAFVIWAKMLGAGLVLVILGQVLLV